MGKSIVWVLCVVHDSRIGPIVGIETIAGGIEGEWAIPKLFIEHNVVLNATNHSTEQFITCDMELWGHILSSKVENASDGVSVTG